MELYFIRPARGSQLALALQAGYGVDERRIFPRPEDTLGVCQGDDVSSGFFDYTEAVELQLADDGCFPRAGCSGEDESSHVRFLTPLDYCRPRKRGCCRSRDGERLSIRRGEWRAVKAQVFA